MFVDLMADIHTTFTERFLRAQLVFNAPPPQPPPGAPRPDGDGRPKKRYNALGILEDVPEEPVSTAPPAPAAPVAAGAHGAEGNGGGAGSTGAPPGDGESRTMDVAPDEPPKKTVAARQDPVVVGAGRARKLSDLGGTSGQGKGTGKGTGADGSDWSSVGRNDPCPCGSGKKFKKCHGAGA